MEPGKNLTIFFIVGFLLFSQATFAQDPQVPSVNLGFTNMQAGKSRPPGLYYIQYIQLYQANSRRDASGVKINGAGLSSSIVTLQQLAYISHSSVLDGNPGFTVVSAFAKIQPGNNTQNLTVNPNPVGDLVAGPFIQWYDKHIFGISLSHRFGINAGFPTGAYSRQYDVNPSAHLFRIFPHYEFTLTPVRHLSLSVKNNFYYFFNQIGTDARPGAAYNMNYAVEYALRKNLTVELAGYYLTQFDQDANHGDHNYYMRTFGLPTTKERVFSAGPGLGFSTGSGLFVEAKLMWETAVRNRTEGVRSTILLSYKL